MLAQEVARLQQQVEVLGKTGQAGRRVADALVRRSATWWRKWTCRSRRPSRPSRAGRSPGPGPRSAAVAAPQPSVSMLSHVARPAPQAPRPPPCRVALALPAALGSRRRVLRRACDVRLVVGHGRCPWGEGGTETMTKALGFTSSAEWSEAVQHLARKLQQAVPGLRIQICDEDTFEDDPCKLLVLVNLDTETYEKQMEEAKNLLLLSCAGGTSQLMARNAGARSSAEVLARCEDLWSRATAEDSFYALLFAIHFSVASVDLVEQEPKIDSPAKLWRLCSRCLREAVAAGLDPEARACLDCQSGCDVRDQTQMYRCTVSHESEALAKLVRCFERRGIFDCDAQIPKIEFETLQSFRGKVLDEEAAWQIMEGHCSSGCSWRPVLGQNPAYDYFPSQYNSWYRDRKNRGWYDPVFKVVTLDGREVWRKRHYRVLPGEAGSFHLSTEDNGISLREYWRIVDADDDLAWAVLHYAGAAKSVGQSYTGSLLVTKDGALPQAPPAERIRQAFEKAGVAAFELYGIQQEQGLDPLAPLTDFRSLKRYKQ